MEEDVSEFCRNIRIIDYFKDSPTNQVGLDLKYDRTNFTPAKGNNTDLDAIINIINNRMNDYAPVTVSPKFNLSQIERRALRELKNNDSLHITRADKGGAFVILNNTSYISLMSTEHTSDVNTYAKIQNYSAHSTMQKIKNLCEKHKGSFTNKEFNYLTNFIYNVPLLYGLPKIHKLDTFNITPDKYGYIQLPFTEQLKFRPIISSSYAPTSHISAFIDEILKPLVPELASYCRDTYHFISKLSSYSTIESETLLATFDVVSLYTNIPHDLGIEAIQFWLQKRRDLIPQRFPNTLILSCIECVLNNNFFRFGNETFLQISGTAMGTKMAPTYAILVMGFLEEKMYTRLKEVYNDDICQEIINSWLRYIDDCWIIWNTNRYGNILIFKNLINSLHPSIKFTIETNTHNINFLDVTVYIEENKLEKDIYHKVTDSRRYVPFNSGHPKHTLHNIPFTLAKRIHSIVSKPLRRQYRLTELRDILLHLKYPASLINNAFQRASNIPQNIQTDGRKILAFNSTFNRNNPNIYRDVISPACRSLRLIPPFNEYRLIKSFRQPKSLLSILNNNDKQDLTGISKCSESRCSSCETLITGLQIVFNVNNQNKVFKIKSNLNCLSLNVIYALFCKGCNEYYIGQTGGMFRTRMTLHRQHINHPHYAMLNVSRHIASCARGVIPKFSASPIMQLSPRCTRYHREKQEQWVISLLQPKLNIN